MKKGILLIFAIILLFNNMSFSQKYGTDSSECVIQLSLYIEDYKLWQEGTGNDETMKIMTSSWRWVFFNCPLASENTFIKGVKIMKHYLKDARDNETKEKYIDTIMMIYDSRIKHFGKEGAILGRRGVDLYKLSPKRYEDVYDNLDKSIELEGNRSKAGVLYYYIVSTIINVHALKSDTSLVIENYDKISDIFDYNISNNPKPEAYEKILATVENVCAPFLNCKDLVRIYGKKFEETPDDLNLLKKIAKILNKKNCNNSELFFKVTELIHAKEPTANSAYLMGVMCYNKKEYSRAAEYLSQAGTLYEDNKGKIKSYFRLAEIYKSTNEYSKARSAALKVIELDPNHGKSYILIGDCYALSAKNCGDNDLTSKAAYWAAVDKYIRAKKVDPDVAEEAAYKITLYSKYFPDKSIVFFHTLEEGDSYTVGCWINEKTTIRASN